MPFQQTSVAGIQPIGSPGIRDFAQNLMRGYQMGQIPQQLAQQKQAQDLVNRLKEAQLNAYPEQQAQQKAMNEARMGLLRAQLMKTQKEAEDPFLGKIAPGPVGQAQWLSKFSELAQKDPRYQDLYNTAKEYSQFDREKSQSTINRNATLANSMSFRLAPTDEKRRMIGTAIGMGLDPAEASQLLSQGLSLKQIADQQGKNLSEVTPIYPLQGEEIKQTRNRRAFANEIKTLEGRISEGMGSYGRKMLGFSPRQIVDAVKGENPDKQGMFLAARALQPELSALRLKAAGGTVGIEAIREMQQSSLANSRVLEGLVSPEAREAMNRYISKWISEAVDTYTGSIERAASLNPEKQEREQSNFKEERSVNVGGKNYVVINGEWYEK